MENLHVISVSDTVTCRQIPKSFTLTNSCWCLSNNGFFCWTNIWLSQCNCNLSNYKLIPKNFRGAAVLYQQSYETHTLGADQIVELILLINPRNREMKQRMKIIQNAEIRIEMKIWPPQWKFILSNCKSSPLPHPPPHRKKKKERKKEIQC